MWIDDLIVSLAITWLLMPLPTAIAVDITVHTVLSLRSMLYILNLFAHLVSCQTAFVFVSMSYHCYIYVF